MASGMGMPSIGIYSYELFNFYGVENIIRIGSAGAIHPDLKVRNLVFAQGACTNSNYAHQFEMPGTIAPIASYSLLKKAVEVADREGYTYKVGNVLSSDTFYDDGKGSVVWGKMEFWLWKWKRRHSTSMQHVQAKTLCASAPFPTIC